MPIPTVQTTPQRGIPVTAAPAAVVGYGPDHFDPVAAVLAFVLPGLGHWYLGEKKRARFIAAGILGLFFGGMLIGGIDVVDRKEDTIWFVGQALVGPIAFGADYIHQDHLKVKARDPVTGRDTVRSARPDEIRGVGGVPLTAQAGQRPPNSKSLGRMNELGTLFATIAGMLNLLVIIDAAMHGRRQ
jgi:hypothetical protein